MHLHRPFAATLVGYFFEGLLVAHRLRAPGAEITGAGFAYSYHPVETFDTGDSLLTHRKSALFEAEILDVTASCDLAITDSAGGEIVALGVDWANSRGRLTLSGATSCTTTITNPYTGDDPKRFVFGLYPTMPPVRLENSCVTLALTDDSLAPAKLALGGFVIRQMKDYCVRTQLPAPMVISDAYSKPESAPDLRDARRWGRPLYFFENIEQFLQRKKTPSGIYTLKILDIFFDFLVENRQAATTVVSFHAAMPNRKDFKLPIFTGQTLAGAMANVILVSDPGLYANATVLLAWFAGSRGCPVQAILPIILESLNDAFGKARLIFTGPGCGGFAALFYAHHFPHSLCIPSNPQTDIAKFDRLAVQHYCEAGFGAKNDVEIADVLDNQIISNLCRLYEGGFENFIIYCQNESDHHVEQHEKPFFESLPEERQKQVARVHGDWGHGHIAPPANLWAKLLTEAVHWPGNWADFIATTDFSYLGKCWPAKYFRLHEAAITNANDRNKPGGDAPAVNPEAVRLVIWDLDETFWKGTVTEGGIKEYIQKHHDIVIELARRGIMSSICSKNDFAAIQTILQSYDIWDYFIFPSISWDPKGTRIASIVEAVQLRPATVMFIDDNPNNRGEAADLVPGLQVADEHFIGQILSDPRFKGKDDSGFSRLQQYKLLEQKKQDELKSSGSNEEFLRSCDVRVFIDYNVEANIDRAVELINRTNQLNYTKRRLPEDPEEARRQLRAEISKLNHHAGLIRVADKYGDYGYVGFFLTRSTGSADAKGQLLHYCFSCRTLGMLVEQWVYDYLRQPLLAVVGDVLTDLSVPRKIDWVRHVRSLDETSNCASTDVIPQIVLWGGCETNALSVYAAAHSNDISAYGNYASGGFFVRLNSSAILASMAKRKPAEFDREAELMGLPTRFGCTNIFDSCPEGAVYIVNCSLDASPIPFYQHKTEGWMLHVELSALPGADLCAISEAELPETLRKLNCSPETAALYERRIGNLIRNYTNVRPLDDDNVRNALHEVISLVPVGGKLILVVDHDEVCTEQRHRYREPNLTGLKRLVADVAGKFDFVTAVSFSDALEDPSEIEVGGGSHYARQVYARFMERAVAAALKLAPKPQTGGPRVAVVTGTWDAHNEAAVHAPGRELINAAATWTDSWENFITRRKLPNFDCDNAVATNSPATLLRYVEQLSNFPGDLPVEGMLFFGQSNAGAGNVPVTGFLEARHPSHVVTFGDSQCYGTVEYKERHDFDFMPFKNPYAMLYIHTPATWSVEHLRAQAGLPPVPRFVFSVWHGGQPIRAFMPGTSAYRRMIGVASDLQACAEDYGRAARVAAIVWIQGEAVSEGYGNDLAWIISSLTTDLMSFLREQKSPPAWLVAQTNNRSGNSEFNQVALDQLELSLRLPGVTLVGPMYQLPFISLEDVIHPDERGRLMYGELLALVYHLVVVQKRPFEPLRPLEARLTGDKVMIKFRVPALPLQWDEEWVKPARDYGFVVEEEGQQVDITTIEITAADTVEISLARPIKRGRVLYAMGQGESANGWAGGRGQLMSPTTHKSLFCIEGFAIPEVISHYCVRFALPISEGSGQDTEEVA